MDPRTITCETCGDTLYWCRRNLAEAKAEAEAYSAWWHANVGSDGLVPWERELLAQSEDPA